MSEFEEIYNLYYKDVYYFVLKLANYQDSVAEEVTQESFYQAFIALKRFRGECSIKTWLCQIAKNTYFAWFNEQKRKQPILQPTPADSTPDIAELFEEKELAGRAFSVLHALEEPYKEVFMLSVFGGFSLKDISTIFGKSESWARVTFYRAKQKLLERMR